jgi:Ca-activated chloride channel family protein
MKRKTQFLIMSLALSTAFILIGCFDSAMAQNRLAHPDVGKDRTLSPYFFVKSDDPNIDPLPLKHTSADIKISGVIANVTITQVYKNEGKKTLEAIYIFPASTRAAVHAMRMTIGERIIEAEIMERQKARETYEQAKREGRTTSLLEQQRPNVFQMNVANILPGDVIKTELKYTELIEPQDQIYEFVFPTVVGPRYSNTPASTATEYEMWVENPYLHSGEPAPYGFDLTLDIQTGIPIAQLTSPSHDISIEYTSKSSAHVAIKEDNKAATQDFVLRYRLAGGRIQTGMLLYPGEGENFFLLMMEPPARIEAEAVVPREYIFIVDVSGSMHGFPIEVSKVLMKDIITSLRPSDFMNVLLFAGSSAVLSDGASLPATEPNKRKAIDWINAQQGGGGTEILPALRRALALPRTEGVSRSVVVVTDGYVSVEPQAFELIRKKLGQANLFAFGIGKSVNRYIIEGMARVGRGEPFVVLDQQEARKQASKFKEYIESPVLTDINVTFRGLKAYDVEPAAVPDLFALRPILIFGKYEGSPSGEVTIRGKTASGDFEKAVHIDGRMASPENSALRLLWARHRIMRLSDLNHLREDDQRVREVTEMGLNYNLMTAYTSFVAVDRIVRADGEIVTIKQPLPLPEGVSDLAVGDHGLKAAALAPGTVGAAHPESYRTLQMALPKEHGKYGATRSEEAESTLKDQEQAMERLGLQVTVEEVRGDLDKAVIEKTVQAKIKGLFPCCLRAIGEGSQPRAEVIYRMVINSSGQVEGVHVVTSTQIESSWIDCMKKVLRRISFLPPHSGAAEAIIKVVCEGNR